MGDKKMRKILHYYTQYNLGGTETVIMNILTNLENKKYKFFLLSQKDGNLDNKFLNLGIPLAKIKKDKNFYSNLQKYFEENNFDVIHVHNCSEMGSVLKIAKKANIKIRIAHSHSARNDLHSIFKVYKFFKTRLIEKNANIFLGCSKDDILWLFPTKHQDAEIFYNAVDIKKFEFSAIHRDDKRRILKVNDDTIVFLTVARLSKEKNHN